MRECGGEEEDEEKEEEEEEEEENLGKVGVEEVVVNSRTLFPLSLLLLR